MHHPAVDTNSFSDLWIAFINGSEDAFSELYRLSYEQLFAYGVSFSVSEEQVRDIIQNLFVKLYLDKNVIKNPSTLRSFLFVSVRNSCINDYKINQRKVELDSVINFDVRLSVDESAIEEEEERSRILNLVNKMLASLTARQKEIIYLRFVNQMEFDEISKVMNMNVQSSRNLMFRAIDKIRRENSEKDFTIFVIFLFYYLR